MQFSEPILYIISISVNYILNLLCITTRSNIYAVQQDTRSVLMSKFIQHLR